MKINLKTNPDNRESFENPFNWKIVVLSGVFLISFAIISPPIFGYEVERVLYKAIQDKDKNRIDSLLKQGIDINQGNYLNLVALEKNREMFQYLLDLGADINLPHEGPALEHEDRHDTGKKTPLCLMVSNFLSSKRKLDSIEGSDEWVEFLLSQGADPNQKCYGKYTPLMMVSGKGADPKGLSEWDRLEMAMKIIVVLLRNGANLNKSVDGFSALHFANQSKNLDLVMFLKSLGAIQ